MISTLSEQLCRPFSVEEIVSATNNFDDALIIGKGGFGTVYKGILNHESCIVAVKRLNPLSKQGAPEFWAEINMLSRFRHSHLVSLIGYCNDGNEMVLVYDYMIHGTLADHLYKNRKNDVISVPLSWVQRLKICIGAARGLDYLHTGTAVLERVIHRDVKSSNILLDGNWAAKISDFGLSRIGPADQDCTDVTTRHIQGTFGYMDPDYFLTRRFTRKTDVYAFGVVLLEVLSERAAVDRSILDEDQWGLAGWGQQCINDGVPHHLIGPNLKWEILQTSLVEFVGIAGQCLHSRPKKRPTMSEVVAKLELALALQLRTNELMDDDFLGNDWPFGSPENTDSFSKIDQIVETGDSSSEHLSQHETPMVLETTNAKPSSNDDSTCNSEPLNTVGDVVEEVATTSGIILTPNFQKFKFSELEIATSNFTLDILGEGGFGHVYKGWFNEKAVAIKRLMRHSLQGLSEGLMEVEILGKLSHPNLVKLLGYCYGEDNGEFLLLSDKSENFHEFLLVYEYMQNRSLDNHLFGNFVNLLPWDTRLNIAIGTARALSFLQATTDHQIVHRDIKTSNILLDEDYNAKLSGFGHAKKYPQNEDTYISTGVVGTYGYAAPEYIATGHLCPESDTYSCGVVLLEILTGLRAMDIGRQQGMTNLVDWAKPFLSHKASVKQRLVDPKLKNDYPQNGALELALLILQCLQNDPKVRPSMRQVLRSLEEISSIRPEIREAQADTSKSMWSWTRNLRKTG